jgi:alkanesulfonate monooxygenase SsuD/methylene tetrahydromethanopterin reductase-like flavin-dependent oxidoreductase (luciferase family)
MKVDGGLGISANLDAVVQSVNDAEQAGYDGFWTAETNHDPFFPLVIAAEHSSSIELGTGIAVAFARNPMTLAQIGNDLQLIAGRFRSGISSRIVHAAIQHPVVESQRMREFVLSRCEPSGHLGQRHELDAATSRTL